MAAKADQYTPNKEFQNSMVNAMKTEEAQRLRRLQEKQLIGWSQ